MELAFLSSGMRQARLTNKQLPSIVPKTGKHHGKEQSDKYGFPSLLPASSSSFPPSLIAVASRSRWVDWARSEDAIWKELQPLK